VDRGVSSSVLLVSSRTSASLPYSSRTGRARAGLRAMRDLALPRTHTTTSEGVERADIFVVPHEQRDRRRSVAENQSSLADFSAFGASFASTSSFVNSIPLSRGCYAITVIVRGLEPTRNAPTCVSSLESVIFF